MHERLRERRDHRAPRDGVDPGDAGEHQHEQHRADRLEPMHPGVDHAERVLARAPAEFGEGAQLAEVRVLDLLRRLIEKRLHVVGFEELHEIDERRVILTVAIGERRRALGVLGADRRRGRERGECAIGERELVAYVLERLGGHRVALHHPRAGARQVGAGVEHVLGRDGRRVGLLDRDVGQIVDVAARRGQRPEAEPLDRDQK
ncbi:hypothetical protein DM47_937 [Burkholderia mallei]|nr:hypothetical protein DM47_937 [Burkholderia mallei]